MFRIVLPLTLLALGHVGQAQTSPEPPTLFRYANLGADWTVILDEPVAVPPSLLKSGGVVEVKPGVYRVGFYQSFEYAVVAVFVTITAAPDDRAVSMRFDYGAAYDFDHEAQSYQEMLGTPASSGKNIFAWEDTETSFKLVRGERGSYSILRSLRRR